MVAVEWVVSEGLPYLAMLLEVLLSRTTSVCIYVPVSVYTRAASNAIEMTIKS